MIEQFYLTPIDETITSTATLSQSGPESNGNERVLNIPQTTGLGLHYQMLFNEIPRTSHVK